MFENILTVIVYMNLISILFGVETRIKVKIKDGRRNPSVNGFRIFSDQL
jgi:hypothetical protein